MTSIPFADAANSAVMMQVNCIIWSSHFIVQIKSLIFAYAALWGQEE